MSVARWLTGDVFDQLATIPDGTVDLVCSSPPFWRQRAYLPADHPDKAREIGQEASPGEFIDVLLRLSAEFRRVLAPHGSIAVELADTMAGSGGAGGDYADGGLRSGQPRWDGSQAAARSRADGSIRPPRVLAADGPLPKSHCMIPEAYRLALAYGINPLTGTPSPAGRWIVRNVIDWCRLNPTPGDDGDKFRRASSDIVIATLNPRRYWDGDAVRVPITRASPTRRNGAFDSGHAAGRARTGGPIGDYEPDGTRPLYDWWELASQPYAGAHYAVWPPEIARRLILSCCPERVCQECGEPSRRIVERWREAPDGRRITGDANARRREHGDDAGNGMNAVNGVVAFRNTLGWTDCDCRALCECYPQHDPELGRCAKWRPGHVLDPFGGSGTTGLVATGNGRNCISIDLDERNLDLARERIGMFLEEPA